MIQDAVEQTLGIPAGADTDADQKFTVVRTACFGCCTLAPVLRIDDETYGNLTSQDVPEAVTEFLETAAKQSLAPEQAWAKVAGDLGSADRSASGEIRIGLDSCCIAQGCGKVYGALAEVLESTGANARLKRVGCRALGDDLAKGKQSDERVVGRRLRCSQQKDRQIQSLAGLPEIQGPGQIRWLVAGRFQSLS